MRKASIALMTVKHCHTLWLYGLRREDPSAVIVSVIATISFIRASPYALMLWPYEAMGSWR